MQSEDGDWRNSWFIYLVWFGAKIDKWCRRYVRGRAKANSRLMVEQGQEREGVWQDRCLAVSLQGPFL